MTPPTAATSPTTAVAAPVKPVRPPLTAAHGAEIVALATTADGGAVVSADRLGGIRLWTTLDGTREPVVIQGTAARSITLARDGDGFLIGVLDAAGGVQVIRASAAGAVRDRAIATRDQPAVEIESTSEGILILRADQTLELVAGDGAVRSRLVPEPGSHVESLVARADHVLALVLEDKQVHGRWITIDHGARWGAATPKLPFHPARAVLSPDGTLLVLSRLRNLHPTLVDVATGTARKTAMCVAKSWPDQDGGFEMAELLRGDNPPVPLGFLSDNVVACAVMNAVMWWNVNGTAEQNLVGAFSVANAPSTVSPRGVIAGMGPNLVIGTPAMTRFLGYGLHDVSQLRTGAGGVLIAGDQHGYVLDPQLRERTRLELGRSGSDWSDAVLVDDRYVITTTPRRLTLRDSTHEIAVFDGVTKTTRQILPYDATSPQLVYEPATRLLATSDGPSSLLVRFDSISHTFGPPIRLANAIMTSRLVLVDPALAGGVALLEIDVTNDGVLVGEVREADLDPAKLAQPHVSYRVPGELRAIDRAGRLYMHRPDDHDDVVVYTRGNPGARLPGVATMTLRPNADGTQVAAFTAPRLALLTGDGTVRWDTAHWSGTDVAWSPKGELLVVFAAALATVDLETGALAERRCGWGFGLSDQQLEVGRGAASICDAAR